MYAIMMNQLGAILDAFGIITNSVPMGDSPVAPYAAEQMRIFP